MVPLGRLRMARAGSGTGAEAGRSEPEEDRTSALKPSTSHANGRYAAQNVSSSISPTLLPLASSSARLGTITNEVCPNLAGSENACGGRALVFAAEGYAVVELGGAWGEGCDIVGSAAELCCVVYGPLCPISLTQPQVFAISAGEREDQRGEGKM